MRTNTIGAVTRVRNALAQAIHRYFHEHGFYWIHTPIVTAADAEGAGEMFRVSTLDLPNLPRTPDGAIDFSQDFFGRPTFLTVSGQLNVEAYCLAMTNVYTFGPTFRAENSQHQPAPVRVLDGRAGDRLCRPVRRRRPGRGLLKYIFRAVLDEREDDMAFFAERIDKEAVDAARGFRGVRFRAHDLHRCRRASWRSPGEIGIPGGVGRQPAGRARALSVRGAVPSSRSW